MFARQRSAPWEGRYGYRPVRGGAVRLTGPCGAGKCLDQRSPANIGLRKKAGESFPAFGCGVYRELRRTLNTAHLGEIPSAWLAENHGGLPRSPALDGQGISLVDQRDGVPVAVACNDKRCETGACPACPAAPRSTLPIADALRDANRKFLWPSSVSEFHGDRCGFHATLTPGNA